MAYQPSKALHPGLTIQRALDALGMTQKKLAERTGLSEKHLSQLTNGEVSITADTALLLENALGGSASYWMNLDKNYKETKARLEQEQRVKEEITLLSNFPYNDLVKLKDLGMEVVPDTRVPAERVRALWKFFGVNSLTFVRTTEAVAYRRQDGVGVRHEALAAWLRVGELAATDLNLTSYDESSLKKLLSELREMTTLTTDFFKELQAALAGVGVGLVAFPHFKNTQVHGATRWIGKNPVIQLSTRGKDADRFWFTLFHEIGHILLHGKKQQFIEFTGATKTNEELEADIFARRSLIADEDYEMFRRRGDFSEGAIRNFARNLKVDPGIVLGRLQKDSLVPYQQLQHLHGKVAFVTPALRNT